MGALKLEHSNLAQHQSGIVQELRKFWIEDYLCDVVLKSHDGAEHHAHTALLSAASVYFRNLLSVSFLEADRVQRKQPVEIAASKTAVSALLDYIYGGQPELSLEAGLELLRMAEAYDLPTLAAAIEAGLWVSLDSNKALQVLQEAPGLYRLKDACEERIALDFEACSRHPDFGKLDAGQLARILKREDLDVPREETVLKSIFTWLNISKDRSAFLCILLQHVDFQSLSLENLMHLHRFTLSGRPGDALHREVDQALRLRAGKRAQSIPSSSDVQPKRQCFKHWSPDLGASVDSGREVWPVLVNSMCWHQGAIYATDFQGNVLSWKPGEPATSARKVVGQGTLTNGINDLGMYCLVSISPSGQLFVSDFGNGRIVSFQNGSGTLLFRGKVRDLFCSPNGVVYFLEALKGQVVRKLVGSTLQTVIGSKNLPKDLQFYAEALFVTKDEVIYLVDSLNNRVLCVPVEQQPVVVGHIPVPVDCKLGPCGLFVTEGGAIYVSLDRQKKVVVFRPGDTTPTEVLRSDPLCPSSLLVQGKLLYVNMLDDGNPPQAGGVYEILLPPELQLE